MQFIDWATRSSRTPHDLLLPVRLSIVAVIFWRPVRRSGVNELMSLNFEKRDWARINKRPRGAGPGPVSGVAGAGGCVSPSALRRDYVSGRGLKVRAELRPDRDGDGGEGEGGAGTGAAAVIRRPRPRPRRRPGTGDRVRDRFRSLATRRDPRSWRSVAVLRASSCGESFLGILASGDAAHYR